MFDPNFIKERITQLRLEKGVSEYQMSYDLGHSRSYIYNISSGRSLPPSNNSALLETTINELSKLDDDDLLLILNIIRRLEREGK